MCLLANGLDLLRAEQVRDGMASGQGKTGAECNEYISFPNSWRGASGPKTRSANFYIGSEDST